MMDPDAAVGAWLEAKQESETQALNSVMIAVNAGRLSLLKLIGKLQTALTNEDENVRSRGTQLLSEVLFRLPELELTDPELDNLTTFLAARLADYGSASAVVRGMYALLLHHTLPEGKASVLLRAVFKSVTVQSLTQGARHSVLASVQITCQKYPEEVIAMGLEFVNGIIVSIDGEKDPRNLLLSFEISGFIFSRMNKDLDDEALEELYDVTSCYFPITFKTPANSPVKVSGDDLRASLRNCLSLNSRLAKWTLYLYAEKVDEAENMSTKVDCLESIALCVRRYDRSILTSFLLRIWTCLKQAILHSGDSEVAGAGVKCVRAFMTVLCPDKVAGFWNTSVNYDWDKFALPLITECVEELKYPAAKLSRAYGGILCAAASASSHACRQIMDIVWPVLRKRFRTMKLNDAQREAILSLFLALMESSKQLTLAEGARHPFDGILPEFLGLCDAWFASGDEAQKIRLLECWSLLGTIHHSTDPQDVLLKGEPLKKVIDSCATLLVHDSGPALCNQCIKTLVAIGPNDEKHLLEKTLPYFFKFLQQAKDTAQGQSGGQAMDTNTDGFVDIISILRAVAALSSTSTCTAVFQQTVTRVLTMLSSLISAVGRIPVRDTAVGIFSFMNDLMTCISLIVEQTGEMVARETALAADVKSETKANTDSYVVAMQSIAVVLQVQFLVAVRNVKNFNHTLPRVIVRHLALIIRGCLQVCRAEFHAQFRDANFDAFLGEDDMTSLLELYTTSEFVIPLNQKELAGALKRKFAPLDSNIADIPAAHLQLAAIFCVLMCTLRKELALPKRQHGNYIPVLLNFAVSDLPNIKNKNVAYVTQTYAIQAIASIVNKVPLKMLDEFVTSVVKTNILRTIHLQEDIPSHVRQQCVHMLVWMTKALVMCGHSSVNFVCEKLCELVVLPKTQAGNANLELSTIAAKGFGIITGENEWSLTRASFANCGPGKVYKQRFFALTFKKLLDYHAAFASERKQESKTNHDLGKQNRNDTLVTADTLILTAVIHLLQHLPRVALLSKIESSTVLVIQGLSMEYMELKLSCLDTLHTFLSEKADSAETHLTTLIPTLLKLASYKGSVHVRVSALKCLHILANSTFHRVFPFVKAVVRGLDSACDDKKREVRRTAMQARNKWHLVGGPRG